MLSLPDSNADQPRVDLACVGGYACVGVLLDVASFWAGALACAGVGALSACYMVCCVKETLVKAGARGPYERVAEDDKEDEVSVRGLCVCARARARAC